MAAGEGVFYGIIDEISDRMVSQFILVACYSERPIARRELKLYLLFLRGRPQLRDNAVDSRFEIKCFLRITHRPLLQVRGIQYLHNGGDALAHFGERRTRHRFERIGNRSIVSFRDSREPRLALREVPLDLVADEVKERFLFAIHYIKFLLLLFNELALLNFFTHAYHQQVTHESEKQQRDDYDGPSTFHRFEKKNGEKEYPEAHDQSASGNKTHSEGMKLNDQILH